MFKPVRQQEAIGCNTQGGVMMKATPAPALVVAQAKLLFKLLIVPFNAPAHLGCLDQIHKRGISGQRRQPVLGRFGLPFWPFDQQLGISLNSADDFVSLRTPVSLIAAGGPVERSDAGVFFIA